MLIYISWAIKLILERRLIPIPKALKPFYDEHFPVMTCRECLYFWNTGKELKMAKNGVFLKKGQTQIELILLLQSNVEVQNGDKVTNIKSKNFLSMANFLSGKPSNYQYISNQQTQFISWDNHKIKYIKRLIPELIYKLNESFLEEIALKTG